MTTNDFKVEMADAMKRYNTFIVALGRTPDEFLRTLFILVHHAIDEYERLPPGLDHGIAVARDVTVILSRPVRRTFPFCNIYFNLHSDYYDNQRGRLRGRP
jgi:hypothetical protein